MIFINKYYYLDWIVLLVFKNVFFYILLKEIGFSDVYVCISRVVYSRIVSLNYVKLIYIFFVKNFIKKELIVF